MNHTTTSELGKRELLLLVPFCGYALYRAWLTLTQHMRLWFAPPAWDAATMMFAHLLCSAGLLLCVAVVAWVAWRATRAGSAGDGVQGAEGAWAPLASRRWACVVAPVVFCVGTLCAAAGGNGWLAPGAANVVALIVGALAAGVGSGFAFVMWGEVYARLSHAQVRAVSLAQLVVPMVFLPCVVLPYPAVLGIACALPVACFACLAWARSRRRALAPAAAPVRRHATRPPAALVAGVVLVCASYGFLQTVLTRQEGATAAGAASMAVAFALAFAIALLAADRTDDPNHALPLRLVVSLLVLGYLLFPLRSIGAVALLSTVLVNGGFLLFEYVLMVALADAASHSTATATLLFAGARVAVTGGVLVGMLAGWALLSALAGADATTLQSVVVLVNVAALAFAGLWLLSERNLHKFFWGEPSAATGALEQQCTNATRRFGLTEREGEILLLWAQGRSVPYIQEALVISASTVSTHTRHIYQKAGVHSRQELLDLLGVS